MTTQTYKEIVTPELLRGAIENREFHGFLEDYHVIHCLLRKYKPKSVFEIGTNMGRGAKIIKNAVGNDCEVYSLDLPTELAHVSLQHPINEGHGDRVGHLCDLPFTQLRGDSMTFDFSPYPCEAFYIDGEHDFEHPYRESTEVLKLLPKLVIWHDSDIPEVWQAIKGAINFIEFGVYDKTPTQNYYRYRLYRVTDTRIAYALRNDIANA